MTSTIRKANRCLVRKSRKHRVVYRYFNKEYAAKVIQDWGKGEELFGFTKGQFSLVELLEAILERTGQADVIISTWTAAARDLQRCLAFLQRDIARSMLWLVDLSFERRVPEFALKLRDMFGESAVRVIPSHCKFILLKNEQWNVVVQTSMNMNLNPRMENFWICDDKEFFEEYHKLVVEIFRLKQNGFVMGQRPKTIRGNFKTFGSTIGDISNINFNVDELESWRDNGKHCKT